MYMYSIFHVYLYRAFCVYRLCEKVVAEWRVKVDGESSILRRPWSARLNDCVKIKSTSAKRLHAKKWLR